MPADLRNRATFSTPDTERGVPDAGEFGSDFPIENIVFNVSTMVIIDKLL